MTSKPRTPCALELALGGDIMTGRGVDQILPHPSSPEIFEDYVRDAREYVALAEQSSGPISRPVELEYVWGDSLADLRSADVRLANLETSVTSSDAAWPGKGINYRMHPENVGCLTAAGFDVLTLANNHILDWGRSGLVQTLDTLAAAGVKTAGAGRSSAEAEDVAVCEAPGGRRVLVVAAAEPESGVPSSWEARATVPGVAMLRSFGDEEADVMARRVERARRSGDVVVVSLHWGTNWGYEVEPEHVRFAHALVERGVDVIFGHSSHHPRPIEIHRGKPILYGCGDLIDDYEGISGYESFRNDLVLLYLLRFEHRDVELRMKAFRIRKMRLERASPADLSWLAESLAECSTPYGTEIFRRADGELGVRPFRGGA
jgi:poly-gamma-glutamate synthesis protein (capsule biosynthesis protein)